MCNERLIKEIEKARANMLSLANIHSISSSEVLEASKELDQLLFKYQKECQKSRTGRKV